MPVKIEITGDTHRMVLAELIGLADAVDFDDGAIAVGEFTETLRDAAKNVRRLSEETKAPTVEPPKRRGRPKKAEPAPAVEVDQDSPEVEVQDEEDELAEEAALAPPIPALTHDDIRDVMGRYVKKFGMAAAQEDCPKLMGAPKASEVANTQEALKAAVDAIRKALEDNSFGRKLAA